MPDMLGYTRISPSEGGRAPQADNREIFFKKYIGWTRKGAITWLVIKLQQRFWYQSNRETEPDSVVYVTISWLEGGRAPQAENREIFCKKSIGGTRKDAITWLVIKIQQRFWYQYNREPEPDSVVYMTISWLEGGRAPQAENREIFFKKSIGWIRKDAITWLVIKLQQRFWYQYNRGTEPDTVVYVTISWLEGGRAPQPKKSKIKIFNMTSNFTIMTLWADIWPFSILPRLKRDSHTRCHKYSVDASFYFIRFRPKIRKIEHF